MSRANWFMPATKSRRNRRVVERQGAVDQFGDQTRLLREELMAHFSPASDIGFECRLSLDDDPDRGRRLGRAVDQPVGRCQSGHRLVEAGLGPVAAAHVEDDGADAPAHRDLGAQAVRPKPLDPTVFELFGSGYAKIDEPRPRRSRHRGDRWGSSARFHSPRGRISSAVTITTRVREIIRAALHAKPDRCRARAAMSGVVKGRSIGTAPWVERGCAGC